MLVYLTLNWKFGLNSSLEIWIDLLEIGAVVINNSSSRLIHHLPAESGGIVE